MERIGALLASDVPVNARVDAASMLVQNHINGAEFEQAGRLIERVEPWLLEPHLSGFYRSMWKMQVGRYLLNRGEDPAAMALYEQALREASDGAIQIPLLEIYGHPDWPTSPCCAGMSRARSGPGSGLFPTRGRGDDRGHTRCRIALQRRRASRRHGRGCRLRKTAADVAEEAGVLWHRYFSRVQPPSP